MEGFVEKIKLITNSVPAPIPVPVPAPVPAPAPAPAPAHTMSVIPNEIDKINNIASLYTLLGDVMMDKPKNEIIDSIKKLILKAQGVM